MISKNYNRLIITLTILVCFSSLFSQTTLIAVVKDATEKTPIPFCSIGVKNKSISTISNEDGQFKLNDLQDNDTLIFIYIGYKRKLLSVTDIRKAGLVLLTPKENRLKEVTVLSDNDYLYELLFKCRKKLLRDSIQNSKVYFTFESETEKQPTELMECYYNGQFNKTGIKQLRFKNGRVGVAPYDSNYFINFNSTWVLMNLNLVQKHDYLPICPLQLNKSELKKFYNLTVLTTLEVDGSTDYQIEFLPKKDTGNYFKGSIWLNKNNLNIKHIILNIINAKQHPFLPRVSDSKIEKVSFGIIKYFNQTTNQPNHINFYLTTTFSMLNIPNRLSKPKNETTKNDSTIIVSSSKGLFYFYDYNNPFIEPYFEYPENMNDYRRIVSLSYNDFFWNNNQGGLVYSDKMKKGISYFKTNGALINYTNKFKPQITSTTSINPRNVVFVSNYVLWDSKKRLTIKEQDLNEDKESTKSTINAPEYISDKYNLKVQIFLDVNPSGDSLQTYTKTVLDVYDTFIKLEEDPTINCFINIYFDLYEIARRKLERELSKTKLTVSQIDSLYKAIKLEIEQQTRTYTKEVQLGKNKLKFKKWNDLVEKELQIDNIKIFNCQ